jgi:endonuclease YncB( thermonuclease family)
LLYENFEGDLIRPIDDLVKDSDTLAMRSDEIRMVGINTSETEFSLMDTSKFDSRLSLSNQRLKDFLKETSRPLRDYLKPKIESNDKIGTYQYEKGMLAKKEFKSLVGKMMNPNSTNLILMTSIETTDRYGRL